MTNVLELQCVSSLFWNQLEIVEKISLGEIESLFIWLYMEDIERLPTRLVNGCNACIVDIRGIFQKQMY